MRRPFIFVTILLASAALPATPQIGAGPGIADEPPGGAKPAVAVLSPPEKTSISISGKKIAVQYSAPSMRKRVMFGGLEPYNKVWRAGANDATMLTTDADLDLGGLKLPKGKYSLFVWLDQTQWQLIVNRETGMSGLQYNQKMDLGRVQMTMSKPPKPIEKFRITLSKKSKTGNDGRLELAWENTIASVDFQAQPN
jgi:hypothetical protein